MDAKDRLTLIRAGATLAGAATIVTVALWFNAPSVGRIEFEVACRRLTLPAGVKLNLNEHLAQLASATTFGFDATLDGVSSIEHSATRAAIPLPLPTVTLAASGDTPSSYLALTPEGAIGTAVLEAEAGATFTALPNAALRVDAGGAPLRLVVQSDGVLLDGERYDVPRGGSEGATGIAWRARGLVPGLFVDLRSRASSPGAARVDVALAPAADEIPLLDSADGVPFASTLRLVSASDPILSLDGRTLTTSESGAVDLSFGEGAGTITALTMILSPGSGAEPRLRVAGWVQTASVRHGRTELLPTWLEETLDTSNLGRSVWITVLGVLAIVLFKAVDGALGAVLNLWFRE